MSRLNWDEVWLIMARTIARRSRCDRRQVGAVIVTPDNQVVAASYNGTPAGMRLDGTCINWCNRARSINAGKPASPEYWQCLMIHAEANALLRADRTRAERGTMYVSSAMCMMCAKLVANSGLDRVVMEVDPTRDRHRNPDEVVAHLRVCGLTVTTVPAATNRSSDSSHHEEIE